MNTRDGCFLNKWYILPAALLLGFGLVTAQAEDVILSPGYIEGTIIITGVDIDSAYVYASGGGFQANTYTSTEDYALTVNVPQGGSLDYDVYARVYSDNNNDRMYFQTQTVAVNDGATSTLDFFVVPGHVQGTVTLNGATLSSGYVYAYTYGGTLVTNAEGNFGSDGVFSFPVQPNDGIRLYGYASDTSGTQYFLDYQYVDVTAGATVIQDWEIAPGSGRIFGDIGVEGSGPADYHHISANMSGNSKYTTVYDNGPYELEGLDAGDWNLYAYSYLNSYDDYLSHPYANYGGRAVTVPSGGEVEVDIISQAAFINGTVGLGGSRGWDDVSYAQIYTNGVYGTESEGGYAQDRVDLVNGNFDLLVTGGDWELYYLNLQFRDSEPSSYLNSYLYLYDYALRASPISLVDGETVDGLELVYQTGSVTVNFAVEDGVTELSSPYLQASCLEYDANNMLLFQAQGRGYGPSAATTQGQATFVGIPMDCTLTAWATVDGSNVTFGQVEVEILPGTDIVVDIGGPTLNVADPSAEYYTTDASVAVSGTATDDVAVSSVTVNGTSVTLSSTNNPSDPNEVAFSTTLALTFGPNTVQTVAIDQSGKSASDTRTVYRDAGPPILDWTPADGTTTSNDTVTVEGTATDDNEITKVTVNGVEVGVVSTGNATDPNEVSFSTLVTLSDGDNAIQVKATDNSNRTTSETHTVTKTEVIEVPALCDADADGNIDRDDINLILAARNQPASSPDDPRDADGNGVITVLDARVCVRQCTNYRCVP